MRIAATRNLRLPRFDYWNPEGFRLLRDKDCDMDVAVSSFEALIGDNPLPLLEILKLIVIDETQHAFLRLLLGSRLLEHLALDFLCL